MSFIVNEIKKGRQYFEIISDGMAIDEIEIPKSNMSSKEILEHVLKDDFIKEHFEHTMKDYGEVRINGVLYSF